MTLEGLPREGYFDHRMKVWLEKLAKQATYSPELTTLTNSNITLIGGGAVTSGAGVRAELPLGNSKIRLVWCWITCNLTSITGLTAIRLPLTKVSTATPTGAGFPCFSGVGTHNRFLRANVVPSQALIEITRTAYNATPTNYAFITGSQSFNLLMLYNEA